MLRASLFWARSFICFCPADNVLCSAVFLFVHNAQKKALKLGAIPENSFTMFDSVLLGGGDTAVFESKILRVEKGDAH